MKITKVNICNNEYLIKGNEAEEYIEKLALSVDKKMCAIIRENPKMSTSMAAVLTAINISDDYFKERDQANTQKALMDDMEKKLKDQQSHIRILESKISKLTQTNESLKSTLAQTREDLDRAKSEFR